MLLLLVILQLSHFLLFLSLLPIPLTFTMALLPLAVCACDHCCPFLTCLCSRLQAITIIESGECDLDAGDAGGQTPCHIACYRVSSQISVETAVTSSGIRKLPEFIRPAAVRSSLSPEKSVRSALKRTFCAPNIRR